MLTPFHKLRFHLHSQPVHRMQAPSHPAKSIKKCRLHKSCMLLNVHTEDSCRCLVGGVRGSLRSLNALICLSPWQNTQAGPRTSLPSCLPPQALPHGFLFHTGQKYFVKLPWVTRPADETEKSGLEDHNLPGLNRHCDVGFGCLIWKHNAQYSKAASRETIRIAVSIQC